MAVRIYIPLPRTTLQRILLWGIPSLTLLGLVGAAGVRLWFYRKTKNKTPSNCIAFPAADQVTTIPSSPIPPPPPPTGERRASAPASTTSGQSKPQERRKNSQETFQERFATPFSLHSSNLKDKQLTSSNLQLLPLESETSLKPAGLATTKNHYPANNSAVQGESFSEESVSSEGILSLPCKSPSAFTPAPPPADGETANLGKSSGVSASSSAADVMRQLGVEAEEPNASSKNSDSLPPVCGKDRVRVGLRIPRNVVGRFIGKQGRNIKSLMQSSNGAHVYVNQKNLPNDAQFVLCTVQGTSVQIKDAMNIIASKYPEIVIPPYSNAIVSGEGGLLHRMSPIPSPHFGAPAQNGDPWAPAQNGDPWEVKLLPAIIPLSSFSAIICYLESLTDVWLVSCEKSVELDELHQSMSYVYCYSDCGRVNIQEGDESVLGKYCAVRVSEIHWLRGRLSRFGDDLGSYEVQLVDYGSIVLVPPSAIRTLRRAYACLPIQAFKAKIAHVERKEGVSLEYALVSLQKIVEGVSLEVHIAGRLPWPSNAPHLSDTGAGRVTGCNKPGGSWLDTATSEAAPSYKAPPSEATPSYSCVSPATTTTSVGSNGSPDSFLGPSVLSIFPSALSEPSSPGAQQNPTSPNSSDAHPSLASASPQPVHPNSTSSSSSGVHPSPASADPNHCAHPNSTGSCVHPSPVSASTQPDPARPNSASSSAQPNSGAYPSPASAQPVPVGLDTQPSTLVSSTSSPHKQSGSIMELPPAASYMPLVELYTQVGSQTPIFINRELVELGIASWKEESVKSF